MCDTGPIMIYYLKFEASLDTHLVAIWIMEITLRFILMFS